MYKNAGQYQTTTLKINKSLEGEPIEAKIKRIMENKEPIKDGAPIIYTERNDGIVAAYNIRTDRFEVAIDAMDVVHRTELAKRAERGKPKEETKVISLDSEAKPTQGNAEV
jgi:hypothetical protein